MIYSRSLQDNIRAEIKVLVSVFDMYASRLERIHRAISRYEEVRESGYDFAGFDPLFDLAQQTLRLHLENKDFGEYAKNKLTELINREGEVA